MEPLLQLSSGQMYTQLGELLTRARIEKNITVEELSSITKIHKSLILSLENNQLENLPNRIYVLGFLKSLSIALEFDLALSIRLYELHLRKSERLSVVESAEEIKPIHKKRNNHLWALGVGLLAFLVLLLSPLFFNNQKNENLTNNPLPPLSKENDQIKKKQEMKPSEDKKPPLKILSPQQVLKIKATSGSSFLAFKIDNNPIRRFTLKKGSTIILRGQTIRLMIGKINNLTIKNNNLTVGVKENSQSYVNLVFPKDLEKPFNTSYFVFTDDLSNKKQQVVR